MTTKELITTIETALRGYEISDALIKRGMIVDHLNLAMDELLGQVECYEQYFYVLWPANTPHITVPSDFITLSLAKFADDETKLLLIDNGHITHASDWDNSSEGDFTVKDILDEENADFFLAVGDTIHVSRQQSNVTSGAIEGESLTLLTVSDATCTFTRGGTAVDNIVDGTSKLIWHRNEERTVITARLESYNKMRAWTFTPLKNEIFVGVDGDQFYTYPTPTSATAAIFRYVPQYGGDKKLPALTLDDSGGSKSPLIARVFHKSLYWIALRELMGLLGGEASVPAINKLYLQEIKKAEAVWDKKGRIGSFLTDPFGNW